MKIERSVTVNITNRTMVTSLLWIILAIVGYHFIGQIANALTLIFISFFLALALNPVVAWVSRLLRIQGRAGATAIAYLLVIVVFGGFLSLVTPPLISQTRQFISDAPHLVSDFQHQNSGIAKQARKYKIDTKLQKAVNEFSTHYSSFGTTVLNTGKRIAGLIVSALVILAMTFMMLVEGPRWIESYWGLTSVKNRDHNKMLARKMYKAVTAYVNAQVVLAIVAGSFCLLALLISTSLLNVSVNIIALAGIVALLGLIPMIGHPISSTIVLLVCLLNSVQLAVVMLIYFVIYYEVENLTIQPFIQSRLNELTPLLVFIAAIVGVEFAGILGAFVAIPTATCIKILLEDRLQRRRAVTDS